MVILSSSPRPSLLEDDLIVPSIEVIRSLIPTPEPVLVKLSRPTFEIVDISGKGQGMVAKR